MALFFLLTSRCSSVPLFGPICCLFMLSVSVACLQSPPQLLKASKTEAIKALALSGLLSTQYALPLLRLSVSGPLACFCFFNFPHVQPIRQRHQMENNCLFSKQRTSLEFMRNRSSEDHLDPNCATMDIFSICWYNLPSILPPTLY